MTDRFPSLMGQFKQDVKPQFPSAPNDEFDYDQHGTRAGAPCWHAVVGMFIGPCRLRPNRKLRP